MALYLSTAAANHSGNQALAIDNENCCKPESQFFRLLFVTMRRDNRKRERERERERESQIVVGICYLERVFATVANTHCRYWLPKVSICYRSRYRRTYLLP